MRTARPNKERFFSLIVFHGSAHGKVFTLMTVTSYAVSCYKNNLENFETFLKSGYKLKKNQGSYLMGKCENNETANSRYRMLVDRFGLREGIIESSPQL
jgi:hypothetical protein